MRNRLSIIEKHSSRFKILTSLFGKKRNKPFHVFVFNTLSEKAIYDEKTFSYNSKGHGKKNKEKAKYAYGPSIFDEPIITNYTRVKNKPITLTYYLKEEE